jgi:hypothetical protein
VKTNLYQAFMDMKCPKGGDVQEFLTTMRMKRYELWAIDIDISDLDYKRAILHGLPDALAPFTSLTLTHLNLGSEYTSKPVNLSRFIDLVSEEADHVKACRTPKDQSGKGKNRSQTDEALAITDGNNRKRCKGKCHHCQKEGHWVCKCFTKKWEEEAAKVQSSQATQASSSTSAGTSTSKPENKPVGSANTVTINDDLDGDGFWAVEDVDTHAHIDYFEPNPEMSDMESDAEEEANAAALEEEDAPFSKALPIPHHALHVPIISHTLAFSGEPDKEGHAFRIIITRRERIAERQNQMLLKLLWVLWHIIWVWLLKPLWGAALQLMILSKHAFKVLYQTSPVGGKVRCAQASLLEGEGMRMPSTSSEQTAAPATPSNLIAPKSLATPSKATPAAAQLPWTVRFYKTPCIVRNPQPGN